jgi:hypothetical protein
MPARPGWPLTVPDAVSNDGFVARLVIAATPPTPCPAQPPFTGVEVPELSLYEVDPVVAVRQ